MFILNMLFNFNVVLYNVSFKIKIINYIYVFLLLRMCIYKILINNYYI